MGGPIAETVDVDLLMILIKRVTARTLLGSDEMSTVRIPYYCISFSILLCTLVTTALPLDVGVSRIVLVAAVAVLVAYGCHEILVPILSYPSIG